jgi:hypothetical protein
MIVCVISRFFALVVPRRRLVREDYGNRSTKLCEGAVPDTIETLIKRNLHEVFGERDARKRREAIAQLWTEDCVFIDHSGKSHGRDELDRAVAVLHQRLPGLRFQ